MMKNLIKNTSLVLVMVVFLGLFLVGCKKDNPQPVAPVVIEPTEPEEPEEKKYLQTSFRLKVYYTKLNLVDTTYIEIVGLGNEKPVDTKVVREGDISITNFREGKYDLIDSTDYYSYQSPFKYGYRYDIQTNGFMTNNPDLFYNLHKEGYIHKVVVEMSNISAIDKNYSRMDIVNKTIFLREFERGTYNTSFKLHYIDPVYTRHSNGKSIYYIKDLINEPVETDMYIEFKDVPHYR